MLKFGETDIGRKGSYHQTVFKRLISVRGITAAAGSLD